MVSRFAVQTQAEHLGDLTVSILKGELGHQRKEVAKLVHWLTTDVQPEVVNLIEENAAILNRAGVLPHLF